MHHFFAMKLRNVKLGNFCGKDVTHKTNQAEKYKALRSIIFVPTHETKHSAKGSLPTVCLS